MIPIRTNLFRDLFSRILYRPRTALSPFLVPRPRAFHSSSSSLLESVFVADSPPPTTSSHHFQAVLTRENCGFKTHKLAAVQFNLFFPAS
jgi:hypothetical protein